MIDQKTVLEVLDILNAEYPDARTMLKYSSVFQLTVAVVLSAQSTDKQVNQVTDTLFKKYPAPADFARAELSELEQDLLGVGLNKGKAKNVKGLATILVEQYGSQVPADFDKLLQLPGIGRKSANVILSVGFNQPALGVDTHIIRLSNRLGWVQCEDPYRIEMTLKELIPVERWSKTHHLLIWHGRKICRARKPQCDKCVIQQLCPSSKAEL